MKRKLIVFVGVFALLIAAGAVFFLAQNNKISLDPLLAQNIEALAREEPGSDPGKCCQNGYKKWHAQTNVPGDRKEYFKDCWCNDKEGYDAQTCSCN